jgi:hypothetical protein
MVLSAQQIAQRADLVGIQAMNAWNGGRIFGSSLTMGTAEEAYMRAYAAEEARLIAEQRRDDAAMRRIFDQDNEEDYEVGERRQRMRRQRDDVVYTNDANINDDIMRMDGMTSYRTADTDVKPDEYGRRISGIATTETIAELAPRAPPYAVSEIAPRASPYAVSENSPPRSYPVPNAIRARQPTGTLSRLRASMSRTRRIQPAEFTAYDTQDIQPAEFTAYDTQDIQEAVPVVDATVVDDDSE